MFLVALKIIRMSKSLKLVQNEDGEATTPSQSGFSAKSGHYRRRRCGQVFDEPVRFFDARRRLKRSTTLFYLFLIRRAVT